MRTLVPTVACAALFCAWTVAAAPAVDSLRVGSASPRSFAGATGIQSVQTYFPPPESQGGWRKLDEPEDARRLAGADPAKLEGLKEWLLQSDDRNFAAVIIRH